LDTQKEIYSRQHVVEIYALFAFHQKVFEQIHKIPPNTHKILWALQLKVPVVHLVGNIVWFIPEFMDKYLYVKDAKLSHLKEAVIVC
jgi:hypothetical protein